MDRSGSKPAAHGALAEAQGLEGSGEYALALEAYEVLLDAGEDGPEIRHGLGCVLHRLGDVDAAVQNLRMSIDQGDLLPSWLGLATVIPGAPSANHQDVLSARAGLSRRLLHENVAGGLHRPNGSQSGSGPLRVGFLSAFFHRPNYMKPVWALLNELSRDEAQLHLFSDAPGAGEWVGYRPRAEDRIHTTMGLDNQVLARLIREQGLDVLIDLNAYSAPGRIPLLLTPHAPVVMGWFNAFATYGLPGVDLILGDDVVVSSREEAHYAEEIRRLSQSYLTFSVPYRTPPVDPPPVTKGNPFTFGSLAPQYKITPPVVDLWSMILEEAPEARLFLANPTLDSVRNRAWVLERFVERGVATGRILFGKPGPHETFLRHYASIDVALDTFPYSGGVTTMEALWQGVPVLTLQGDRWAGRTSRTLLHHAGLPEWIAEEPQALLSQAVELAKDRESGKRLARLRRVMRNRLVTSPVCDVQGMAEAFTHLFRDLPRA